MSRIKRGMWEEIEKNIDRNECRKEWDEELESDAWYQQAQYEQDRHWWEENERDGKNTSTD